MKIIRKHKKLKNINQNKDVGIKDSDIFFYHCIFGTVVDQTFYWFSNSQISYDETLIFSIHNFLQTTECLKSFGAENRKFRLGLSNYGLSPFAKISLFIDVLNKLVEEVEQE